MAVFTKAVFATVLELLSALAVGTDVEPVTERDVALAISASTMVGAAMVTAPVNSLYPVMVCVVLVVTRLLGLFLMKLCKVLSVSPQSDCCVRAEAAAAVAEAAALVSLVFAFVSLAFAALWEDDAADAEDAAALADEAAALSLPAAFVSEALAFVSLVLAAKAEEAEDDALDAAALSLPDAACWEAAAAAALSLALSA